MTWMRKNSRLLDWLFDILASLLQAVGVWCFVEPCHIAPGGASGIALLINFIVNVPVGALTLLINVPLLIASFFLLDRKMTLRTIRTVVIMTVCLDYIAAPLLPQYYGDRLISSAFGGILVGASMALIFARGSTSGGGDILAKLLQKRWPWLHTGYALMLTDLVIITLSVPVFGGLEDALYGLISMVCTTQTIDAILYGMNKGTMVLVASRHNHQIADDIMAQLGRGTTFLKSVGGYSHRESEMLMCIVDRKQFYAVKGIIDRWDRTAFVVASETKEVYGEGFLDDPRDLIKNAAGEH